MSHYWGIYLAMERIEINANRLALQRLRIGKTRTAATITTPPDLSGGYLLAFERSLWPTDVRVNPTTWATAAATSSTTSCPTGDGRNLTYLLEGPSAKVRSHCYVCRRILRTGDD
jgi:hypothetical protein